MTIHNAVKRIDPRYMAVAFLPVAFLTITSSAYADDPAQATTKTNPITCEEARNGITGHAGNFYSGETHFQVTDLKQDCGLLADTRLVIVDTQRTDETRISTDQSVAGRLDTRLFLRKDPDSVEASKVLAQQVRDSFTKSIVKKLNDLNFATDVGPTSAVDERNAIIIRIDMTEIDAGNKSKRVMIGLGRGASQVVAKVTLIARCNGKELPLQEIVLDSQSGKQLGALTSPFGGAVAVNVAEGDVGDRKSTPQADAARMAKGLAQYLNKLVVASSGTGQSESAPTLEPSQVK